MNTLYDILGVERQATLIQIEHAYRHCVDAVSINAVSGSAEADEIRLRALKESYSILSSTSRRRIYDTQLFARQRLGNEVQSQSTSWIKIILIVTVLFVGAMYLLKLQSDRSKVQRLQRERADAQVKPAQLASTNEPEHVVQAIGRDDMPPTGNEEHQIADQDQQLDTGATRDASRSEQPAQLNSESVTKLGVEPEIIGSPAFKHHVEQALGLLKAKAPEQAQTVNDYVGRIEQSEHTGMAAFKTPPTIQMNDRTASYSVTWAAGAIAHESFHAKLYLDYKKRGGAVPASIWTGQDAENQCMTYQLQVLKIIIAPTNEIEHVLDTRYSYQNKRNKNEKSYWQRSIEERDW